jgi:uncharacterized membrane protein YhaH (DUF805 family)
MGGRRGNIMDIDWKYLFTSFEGRINRKPYWIGWLAFVAVWLVVFLAGWSILGDAMFGAPLLILQLVALYPAAAILVKRLHDRNRPTYFIYFYVVPAGLFILLGLLGISDPMAPSGLDMILGIIMMIVGIWFLIELGFLKGTTGPNRHGPDPLGDRQAEASAVNP